jgi:cytochrome c-type biogenesis protein CcmH
MEFWFLITVLILVVLALLARVILRGATRLRPWGRYDLDVYRDHLDEVERDLERAIISAEEAGLLRTEVSRRILSADSAAKEQTNDSQTGPIGAVLVLAAIGVAAAVLIYTQQGTPGYADLALNDRIQAAEELRQNRPSQSNAERLTLPGPTVTPSDDFLALMQKLRRAVAQHPDDLRGQTLLARNEAALGNFIAAHTAQAQVIFLKQGNAQVADYARYAEMLVHAAGGYVSPPAETALTATLERNPAHQKARYYMGLMYAQTGRPDFAFRIWQDLLQQGVDDPSLTPLINAQIEAAAFHSGVEYTPSDLAASAGTSAGPSAADIEAADAMTSEDRKAMIAGMVAQLSQRLASEGGPATDWARLIDAHGVLNRPDQAAQIWLEAQQAFAGNPDALRVLLASARRAGVAQ